MSYSRTAPPRFASKTFAVVFAWAATILPAAAQSTWLGGQTTPAPPPYLWSNAANWVGGTVPGTGSDVVFADATAAATSLATTNDLAGLALNSLTDNASATGPVAVGGNGFTLGAGGINLTGATQD